MNMNSIRDVMDIIASGYGSTPTGLDRAIASRVIEYFQNNGWVGPSDLAYLVQAAGGELVVKQELFTVDAPLLQWAQDPITHDIIVRTIDKDKLVKEAKVNPDAESRIVDSGPINIATSSADHNS